MRPPLWLWLVVLGLVFLLLHGGARLRRARELAHMRQRMHKDAEDPFRHWVQCVFRVITGDCDYGYLPREEARAVLLRCWSVEHPVDLRQVLDELERSTHGEPAWNLVRFIVLVRLGVAAGFVPEATGWRRLRPIARRLQQEYPSFDAIAQAYLASRQRWQSASDSAGDDGTHSIIGNVANLQEQVWPEVAFDLEL